MRWLIEKIKTYLQTKAQIKKQRANINREIEAVKSKGMEEPPTHDQAIVMYTQVSTKGAVVYKGIIKQEH